jgi:hypothetical protein
MKKKTDNRIARLAGALQRKMISKPKPALTQKAVSVAKTPTRSVSPKPATAAPRRHGRPPVSQPATSKYHQTVLRVPDALWTHANMLALSLSGRLRNVPGHGHDRITPNFILLMALNRWATVEVSDIERLEHDGRVLKERISAVRKGEAVAHPSDEMKCPMWLPRTMALQDHLRSLQAQFVQRGLHMAKFGANEPAICRQALWRWVEITPQDVENYLKTAQAGA